LIYFISCLTSITSGVRQNKIKRQINEFKVVDGFHMPDDLDPPVVVGREIMDPDKTIYRFGLRYSRFVRLR